MKKIFFLLTVLISYVAHSQDDTTKYIWYKFQYGSRMPRFWADSVLKAPAFRSPEEAKAAGRAGNITLDTLGGGKGLWYYLDNTWYHVLDSANSGKTFGVNDASATAARLFDKTTYDFNISGSGKMQFGSVVSGSDGYVQISNPTSGKQHLFVGHALHSNNVYSSFNAVDTLTTANNKSTGLFNQYLHDIRNNMTLSGWGFGSHWRLMVPDTSRLDPVGSDLAGAAIFRTLIEPNTGVATGKHTVKAGTFTGDYVGGIISIHENTGTTSSNWVNRKGDWAMFIGHQVSGNSKDSIGNIAGLFTTNFFSGHGDKWDAVYAGPVGNFDTVRSLYSPYVNAYLQQTGPAYFGGAVSGNRYAPVASAQVEIYNPNKGFLLNRGTASQRTGISSPATGLLYFDTDSASLFQYTGSAWQNLYNAGSGGGGSQTWQQTLTTGSTLTGDNSIAGGGFNFYHTNTGNFRIYGTGTYSSERLVVTSGGSGVALLGRESTSVYFQGSDSLYHIGTGQKIDTTTWKVVVQNRTTGALAYAPWQYAQGAAWLRAGISATAGSVTGDFIGTTNSVAMRFRTNNVERMVLDSSQAQLRIGGVSATTTGGARIKNPGNGNYDGYYVESSGGTTGTEYGYAGASRSGGWTMKTLSGSISLFPGTGVYIGAEFATADARLKIKASTTTAGTGQVKLEEGSRQTSAEDGTINYVSNNLEFVETSTVYKLAKTLTATASLDFSNTLAQTSNDLTITVTGAVAGDPVALSIPHGLASSGTCFTAWVSSSDTVTVRFNNFSTGAVDLGSGSFTASVIHY